MAKLLTAQGVDRRHAIGSGIYIATYGARKILAYLKELGWTVNDFRSIYIDKDKTLYDYCKGPDFMAVFENI